MIPPKPTIAAPAAIAAAFGLALVAAVPALAAPVGAMGFGAVTGGIVLVDDDRNSIVRRSEPYPPQRRQPPAWGHWNPPPPHVWRWDDRPPYPDRHGLGYGFGHGPDGTRGAGSTRRDLPDECMIRTWEGRYAYDARCLYRHGYPH